MEETTLLEDFSLHDVVIRDCKWTRGDITKERSKQQLVSDVLTEEMMGQLDDYLGNALGKVTVGGELGHSKEYGCSAKSFVSMSVTCDGGLETCQAVHKLIQPVVRALINEDLQMMKEDRDAHLNETPRQPVAGKVAPGPPRPHATVASPARVAPKGQPRPNFRR